MNRLVQFSAGAIHKAGFRPLAAFVAGFLLTGCTLLPMPPAPPPCAQASDGLISWWPGEADAADAVGINAATLADGASFDKGMVGQGFRFDGVDDFATASGTGIDDLGQLTIEAWVELNSLPNTPNTWTDVLPAYSKGYHFMEIVKLPA